MAAYFGACAVIAAVHAQIIRSVEDRTKKLRFFGAALHADFRWKRHIEGCPRLGPIVAEIDFRLGELRKQDYNITASAG
jgi:hypothetical protein